MEGKTVATPPQDTAAAKASAKATTTPASEPSIPPFDFDHLLTLPEILRRSARLHPKRDAILVRRKDVIERLSYEELDRMVDEVAWGLLALGLQPDDKVAFLAENRPEWVAVYFAVQRAGGVSVPLDPQLGVSEVRHLLNQSEAKFVFTSARYADLVTEAVNGAEQIQRVIFFDPNANGTERSMTFEELRELGRASTREFPKRNLDDLAAIIFTSGTTGVSKGVMLTHRNLASNCASSMLLFPILDHDVFYALLPLHHTFPAMAAMILPIGAGVTITIGGSLKSRDILDDIAKTKVTIFTGVPLLFEKMIQGILREVGKKPAHVRALFKTMLGISKFSLKYLHARAGKKLFQGLREKAGMTSLRLLVSGGAPISPDVLEMYNYLGFQFVQGYGLTETSPVLSMSPPDKLKPRSVGPPVKGAEIRIVNPDEHGVGEIVVRGPMVMKGYYKNPKETAKVLKDGWFYTGDLGWIDKDGFLYIAGRAKNVIVTKGGKNVFPEEIEEKLLKSPFIEEVLVVGRQTDKGEEYIHAIVYPNFEELDRYAAEHAMESLSEEEIEDIIRKEIRQLTAELPPYKSVSSFEIIEEEFPKTSTRKIKRYLFQHKIVGVGAKK